MIILPHRDFKKDYKKADKKIREQFRTRRDLFVENPRHPLLDDHALDHEWIGCRSFNVNGDWRAIYRSIAEGVVQVVALGTHTQLYKKQ